jgi:hypothetical protein
MATSGAGAIHEGLIRDNIQVGEDHIRFGLIKEYEVPKVVLARVQGQPQISALSSSV